MCGFVSRFRFLIRILSKNLRNEPVIVVSKVLCSVDLFHILT